MSAPNSSPGSFFYMVQHLIEQCIVMNMSKEACISALMRVNISPIITSTVWSELERENREFFAGYERRRIRDSRSQPKN